MMSFCFASLSWWVLQSVKAGAQEPGIVCFTLTQGRSKVLTVVALNSTYHALPLDNNGGVVRRVGLVAFFRFRTISI